MLTERHEIEFPENKKRYIITITSSGTSSIIETIYKESDMIHKKRESNDSLSNKDECIKVVVNNIESLSYRITSSFIQHEKADERLLYYAKYFTYSPQSGEVRYILNNLYPKLEEDENRDYKEIFYEKIDSLIANSNLIDSKLRENFFKK